MVNERLAESYLKRAGIRLEILPEYLKRQDYADVIREAQEIVELIQKALLIKVGIRPPKWHEVGSIINEHIDKFPHEVRETLFELNKIAKWLRSQREISFYGDMDLIPEELYSEEEALKALSFARDYYSIAEKI